MNITLNIQFAFLHCNVGKKINILDIIPSHCTRHSGQVMTVKDGITPPGIPQGLYFFLSPDIIYNISQDIKHTIPQGII